MAEVEVTRADRVLFNDLFRIPERHMSAVLDGTQDCTDEMQKIARHRLAALEQAAAIADNWNPGRKDRVTEKCIASAIRALVHGGADV